ncbi:unnamed protein product [Bemisia tabaci]|uniref:J domain-containing protein n=1 Tax=Bemisia tabaci TaxID=7038 RepID=A0A9P0ANQ0_BEMTA|nr:unnamed protein product [Bemisia tabaci]
MAANKTLYDILGIGKNANGEDIKKAYRVKSKIFHPDKGGDKEIMALLNKAYEILSDPTERNIYDGKWFDVAKDFSDDYDDSNTREAKPTSGSLPAAGDAYSRAFKLLHAKFVEEFRKEPSKQGSASSCLKPFRSTVFSSAEHGAEDLFSFIKANKDSTINLDVQPLTLRTASRYFINFVQGDTDGLYNVCKAFNGKLKELEKAGQQSSFEFQLYSGMYEILLVAYKDKAPDEKILFSLLKITDFATQNIKNTMTFLGPLFQNKHFRDLFSLALHYFWLSEESALNKSYTKNFRGNDKIAELIEKLRSKLSELRACRQSSRSLIEVLQHASVLLELERDLGEDATDLDGDTDWQSSLDELSAVAIKINEKFYREKAFHLLDWLPYLQENAGQRIVVNTLLQIGIAFLKSARIEPDPSVRMADEKVASQLLLLAVQIGHHAEPDIELYACLHGVKCLLSCKYINPHFEQILHGIQARALWLVDFFPFFQPPRSNADVFTGNKKPLYLMRGLLYHLIDRAWEQDLQDDAEAPDLYVGGHSLVRVFYHAFEACLKNWYKKKPDPELERQFGRRLMQVLLLSKQWSENDINYNLNAPWPLDDLDEEGWTILRPSILPSARKANIPTLKTLKGFGLDHKTGEISLFLEYNGEDDSDTDRLFTFDDLHELVRGGVTGAAFSLDMTDPNMPYHPFNKMWFRPENLYHSRLLHTMFITDYLLKFLTVGQEVQRCDPYDYRSLEQLMARLPDHLKKVIDDFHAHRRGEDRTNRFWIEVEELLFDTDNDESYEEGNVRLFAFGRIRMTVKSCRMERDVEGNLIDKDGENEGWDCYVLSREQEQDLSSGKRGGSVAARKNDVSE